MQADVNNEENKDNIDHTAGSEDAVPDFFAQETATAFVEKRKFIRHKVRWRALVLAIGGAKIPMHVVDISEGGLSLLSSHPLAPNSRSALAVFVPDAAKLGQYLVSNVTIKVQYQVLRAGEYFMGAEFCDPSPVFLDRMRAAVQRGFLG